MTFDYFQNKTKIYFIFFYRFIKKCIETFAYFIFNFVKVSLVNKNYKIHGSSKIKILINWNYENSVK